MKKVIAILAVLSIFTLGSSNVWAQWGGPMMHRGWGSGYMNTNGNSAFMDATVQLRSELSAKQAEYSAFMMQKNPDPKRAAQLSREISSLNEQLRIKAKELRNAGNNSYTPYNSMPMQPYGPMGPMHGQMHGGYWCW